MRRISNHGLVWVRFTVKLTQAVLMIHAIEKPTIKIGTLNVIHGTH